MDYTSLFKNSGGKKSKVGIIGATRGYGYTLLAQIPKVEFNGTEADFFAAYRLNV